MGRPRRRACPTPRGIHRGWLAIAAGLVSAAWSRPALGHGLPPYATSISVVGPTIAIQTTFGLVLGDRMDPTAGGWRWICLEAMNVRGLDDPPTFGLRDGSLLAPTLEGLYRGTADACEWHAPSDTLTNVAVIDGQASPDDVAVAYVVTSRTDAPNSVFATDDGGRHWRATSAPIADDRFETLHVAPSRAERIYVAGVHQPTLQDPPQAAIHRSDDAGATWVRRAVCLREGERNLYLLGVDPTAPDHLLARVSGSRGARVIRSTDAGETFADVLEVPSAQALAWHADGHTVVLSAAAGTGVWRSSDGGATFEALRTDLAFRCLHFFEDELWGCGGEETDLSVSRSFDRGESFETILAFTEDLSPQIPCPPGTTVGDRCPPVLSDVRADLGLDLPQPDDTRDEPPVDPEVSEHEPSAAGCSTGHPPAASLGLLLLAVARRHRRDERESADG